MKATKAELIESWMNYHEQCKALSVIPTMEGYGKFLVDSYEDK